MAGYLRWGTSAIGLAALVASVWIQCRDEGVDQFSAARAESALWPLPGVADLKGEPRLEEIGRETQFGETALPPMDPSPEGPAAQWLHEVFTREGADGSWSQICWRTTRLDGMVSTTEGPILDEFTVPPIPGSDSSDLEAMNVIANMNASADPACPFEPSGDELNQGLNYRPPATFRPAAQPDCTALNQGIAYDDGNRLRELLELYQSPMIQSE